MVFIIENDYEEKICYLLVFVSEKKTRTSPLEEENLFARLHLLLAPVIFLHAVLFVTVCSTLGNMAVDSAFRLAKL